MVGNPAANVVVRCRAERGDLCARRRALRSANARICRCAGVAHPYIYALTCMPPTLVAIVDLSMSFLSEGAPNAESAPRAWVWPGSQCGRRSLIIGRRCVPRSRLLGAYLQPLSYVLRPDRVLLTSELRPAFARRLSARPSVDLAGMTHAKACQRSG